MPYYSTGGLDMGQMLSSLLGALLPGTLLPPTQNYSDPFQQILDQVNSVVNDINPTSISSFTGANGIFEDLANLFSDFGNPTDDLGVGDMANFMSGLFNDFSPSSPGNLGGVNSMVDFISGLFNDFGSPSDLGVNSTVDFISNLFGDFNSPNSYGYATPYGPKDLGSVIPPTQSAIDVATALAPVFSPKPRAAAPAVTLAPTVRPRAATPAVTLAPIGKSLSGF